MGCNCSRSDKIASNNSKAIEKSLEEEHFISKNEIKLLLLGAGESGKSTIIKQMRILYQNGFSDEERIRYRKVIYNNIVQSLVTVIKAMETLSLKYEFSGRCADSKIILSLPSEIEECDFTSNVISAISRLWADAGVQTAINRSQKFQLNDSTAYFQNAMTRIARGNYIPTDQDVLRSRVQTSTISESCFDFKGLKIRMLDVGGQRSERRKWIHFFDNVTAVLFVVAMSEYDLYLIEDESMNRMHESIKLFRSICNSKFFVDSGLILLLNKKDVFREKIAYSTLSICFPDYKGSNEYEDTSQFIRLKFESLCEDSSRIIYTHFSCATNTEGVGQIFEAIAQVIIQQGLRNWGLY